MADKPEIITALTDIKPSSTSNDLQRTIYNETVKLNASYLNSLSVWFAGAGSLGALTATFVAPLHNYWNAAVVVAIGVLSAIVLKLLANRTLKGLL